MAGHKFRAQIQGTNCFVCNTPGVFETVAMFGQKAPPGCRKSRGHKINVFCLCPALPFFVCALTTDLFVAMASRKLVTKNLDDVSALEWESMLQNKDTMASYQKKLSDITEKEAFPSGPFPFRNSGYGYQVCYLTTKESQRLQYTKVMSHQAGLIKKLDVALQNKDAKRQWQEAPDDATITVDVYQEKDGVEGFTGTQKMKVKRFSEIMDAEDQEWQKYDRYMAPIRQKQKKDAKKNEHPPARAQRPKMKRRYHKVGVVIFVVPPPCAFFVVVPLYIFLFVPCLQNTFVVVPLYIISQCENFGTSLTAKKTLFPKNKKKKGTPQKHRVKPTARKLIGDGQHVQSRFQRNPGSGSGKRGKQKKPGNKNAAPKPEKKKGTKTPPILLRIDGDIVVPPKTQPAAQTPAETAQVPLQQMSVVQEFMRQLHTVQWQKNLNKKDGHETACCAVIDSLLAVMDNNGRNVMRDLAYELVLGCKPKTRGEIARKYVNPARASLGKYHQQILTKAQQRFTQVTEFAQELETQHMEFVVGEADDEDLDAHALKTLQAGFQTPGLLCAPGLPTVVDLGPKHDEDLAPKVDDDEGTEVTQKPRVPDNPIELFPAYTTDDAFVKQKHWVASTRGESGWKYVTVDTSKAKPWRVKVCALACALLVFVSLLV